MLRLHLDLKPTMWSIAVCCTWVLSVPAAVHAEDNPMFTCSDGLVEVEAKDVALEAATCDAVTKAKALLSSCGLTQRSPIRIDIVDRAMHPSFGEFMATFDADSGRIQITHPDAYTELLSDGDARAQLPQDVVFGAVVTHELVHAFLAQAVDISLGAAEQEFIANAFEMETINPEWRNLLLEAEPVNPLGDIDLVHPAIYALSPRAFANNAWRLFRRADYGCALVQDIISDDFMFPRY